MKPGVSENDRVTWDVLTPTEQLQILLMFIFIHVLGWILGYAVGAK